MLELAVQEYSLPKKPANLYDSITYIIKLGGKRLRPVMVLMGCDLMRGDLPKALPVSLAVELFHNFSLMHDDIMDNADLRRGQPSVHKKWNVATAILGGDALLVKAYQLLMTCEEPQRSEVLNLFNQTALEVCEGQQMDMNFEDTENVSIEEYVEMIRLKTAVLMGASFKMGAIMADASPENQDGIYTFGQDLGIAFQLKDDYLDCFGEKQFGKVVGGDIIENKKTYLYLKTLELGTEEQKKLLLSTSTWEDSDKKVKEVSQLFEETGARTETETKMNEFYNNALDATDGLDISKEGKALLSQFAESVWKRQK